MKPDRSAEIQKFIEGVGPFLDAMLADMQFVGKVPRSKANGVAWDRANVRAFFSVLEALSNFLQSQALFLSEIGWNGLDAEAIARLQERSRRTLRDNVKSSLRSIAAIRNPKLLPLDFDKSQGWAKLLVAEAVRDRITHPKSAEDLTISQKEAEAFNGAVAWYFRLLLDCLALPRTSLLGKAPP